LHYSERIAHLQAICLSSLPPWREEVEAYLAKLPEEERKKLIACLERQVRHETKLLAAKKAVLTIATKPKENNIEK
jgi:hypothetical protein